MHIHQFVQRAKCGYAPAYRSTAAVGHHPGDVVGNLIASNMPWC
ncbi:hypothetical protein OAQ81_01845 [Candidatus Thioglobus sp.]|nr:hypothetical protein [Candidatus Thioglobus sp.]